MRIWKKSVQKSWPNHLRPFDGIGDFDSCSDYYPKTLFRFPLRTKESSLSDKTYTPDMLLELLDALRYEAKYLLLFLRSLEQIVVYTISRADKKSIIFQVEVDRDDRDDLRHERIYLGERLKEIYVQDKKYGIAEQLYFTSNFTINIRSNQSGKCITQSTKWIISNLVGSDKDDVRHAAEEVNAFPTVGTALEVESEFSNECRIFCFLPLPSEACTVLPVHINGTFSLEDNRRDLKWPSRERRGDSTANWNVLLVNKVLPICYDMLLKKALEILKNDPWMFYQAIPNACTVKDTKWEGLLKPLYSNLFKTYACFCSISKEWVILKDDTFIPEEMCCDSAIEYKNYNFLSMWPLMENLKSKNPWENFIPQLYKLISRESLCYSENVDKWLDIKTATVVSPDILHKDYFGDVLTVLKQFKEPVIDLPSKYHLHFTLTEFSECNFLSSFFEKIKEVPVARRNNILLSLIKSYAFEPSEGCQNWINKHSCIPCSPHGKITKKCKDIIDPKSKLSFLYEPKDSMFPISSFQENLIHATLVELGMLTSKLPWHMIVERASTVKALYASDKTKALCRTQYLLHFMEEHIIASVLPNEAEDLKHISFLPVLQRPRNYPKDLSWAGSRETLLCSNQLLRETYSHKIYHLVGSQKMILSQRTPSEGGCGLISNTIATALGINCNPFIEDAVKHLIQISNIYSCPKMEQDSRNVNSICEKIYSFLNEHLCNSKRTDHKFIKQFYDIHKLLWNGEKFIHPANIATSWKLNGPYLYCLPYVIKNLSEFLKYLNIKECFDRNQLLQTLLQIKNDSKNNPISNEQAKIVKNISEVLAKDDKTNPADPEGYLYDEKMHMRHVKDLAYNDAPWCKLETDCFFVHHDFSRPDLEKIGIKFIRSKALDQYDTSECHFVGVPFGQHEELTQRIKNILDTYIYNETVLKELLQNADDAKVTKLYFIIDERKHGTNRVFSSEWKDLQGPALLVWNDKGFTEEDLVGIQKLGLGSKRTNAESIGQYGIGFNVVYHLTDCPSLLTGSTLCIFYPHCRYVPGASLSKPGRRLNNVDKKFWDDLSDLQSPYLQDTLEDCPNEIKHSGSLFRFPLRSSEEIVKKSKLVDENAKPMQVWKMKEQLKEWAPKLKEALLFLKHVVELSFCTISDSKFNIVHQFKAELHDNGMESRDKLSKEAKQFCNGCTTPFITHYPVNLIQKIPIKEVESWLVQQGVGDVNNPSQHWEYLSHICPMHGLAAQIGGLSFTPKIFCFLPLPLPSNLPVHVNANFILDSSSRSSLWKSRDLKTPDDNKKWNDRLVKALGSSYAQFLVNCQNYIFDDEPYSKSKQLKNDTENYYSLFPKWLDISVIPEGEMLNLAKHMYTILTIQKSNVFAVSYKIILHEST